MVMAIDDLVKVRVVCYIANQISVNVYYYKVSNVLGAPVSNGVCGAIDSAFAPLYKACLNTQAKYRGVGMSIFRTTFWFAEETSVANDGAGVGGGLQAPLQSAGLITKQTGFAGRRNRGRAYIPFHASADVDPTTSAPNAGYQTNLGGVAARITGVFNYESSPGNHVELAPVLARKGPGPVLNYILTNITGATTRPKFGTQRRRGNYGQPNVLPF